MASGGLLLAAVVYAVLYFLPNLTATQFIGILTVGMFGYGIFNLVIWAFVTDVIDYHEYLTGLREDGTVYSIYSMARKIGQAVAGGVGGAAIAAVGYNASAESTNKRNSTRNSYTRYSSTCNCTWCSVPNYSYSCIH